MQLGGATAYHLVWGTKKRQPLINPDREKVLYDYIIGKADALCCIVHAIGGVDDHIHLVVSIPPALSIADFVKTIKGSSAYHLNQDLSAANDKFAWQEGYGVQGVTIRSKDWQSLLFIQLSLQKIAAY